MVGVGASPFKSWCILTFKKKPSVSIFDSLGPSFFSFLFFFIELLW
jgi:hypothetical protein